MYRYWKIKFFSPYRRVRHVEINEKTFACMNFNVLWDANSTMTVYANRVENPGRYSIGSMEIHILFSRKPMTKYKFHKSCPSIIRKCQNIVTRLQNISNTMFPEKTLAVFLISCDESKIISCTFQAFKSLISMNHVFKEKSRKTFEMLRVCLAGIESNKRYRHPWWKCRLSCSILLKPGDEQWCIGSLNCIIS